MAATETVSGALTMQVPNVTSVGGGSGGGRTQAAALAANGVDLYAGYKASGDIMKLTNAPSTSLKTPQPEIAAAAAELSGYGSFLRRKQAGVHADPGCNSQLYC